MFLRFMQIVSTADNLHEMSSPVFWEHKKNIVNLSSTHLAQRVVNVKYIDYAVKKEREKKNIVTSPPDK